MEDVVRIVLGLAPHELAVEVMDYLDRSGRARVVATAGSGEELAQAVRRLEPTAVVGSPALVRAAGGPNGSAYLAVDTAESVGALRAAIGAGARGFFLWPSEREQLAGAALRLLSPPAPSGGKRARVVGVYGPRGGAGATFLATHLAMAFAGGGRDVVLVDVDALFGDVSAAVGARGEPAPRTIADLAPVAHELTPRHLSEVLWTHPAGFRILLAPPEALAAEAVSGVHYRSVVSSLSATTDVVVLHLPRGLDERARSALDLADRLLMVLTLDVLAFRAGRRALDVLGAWGLDQRCEWVVNRAARAEIAPSDVKRVFGRDPVAVIPVGRGVTAAQNRGRLMPLRGRTGRRIARLADRVLAAAA